MLRKDDILLTQPALWSKLKVYGKTIKYVQLLTPNLSSSTSVVPSTNGFGSYITILEPSLVGHKVYVKIIADDNRISLGWYKNENGVMGYDLITGNELNASSTPSATEGVYEITQDMVHSGTNYLQLYWFVYSGLPTGSHTITVQLVDLTELGMDNIINPVLFNATDLGKYMQNNTLNRGSGLISVESPLKASEGTYNQLEEDLTSPYIDRGLTCSFNIQTKHYVINGTSTTTYARTLKDINVLTSHKYFMKMSIVKNDNNLSFRFQLLNAGLYTPIITNGSAEVIGNPSQNIKTNVGITGFSIGTVFNNVEAMFLVIDITELFGAGNEPTTIDQFYATNVGKLVKKYGYLPYSATNTQFGRTLNLIKEGNHIKLNGIGDLKDTYTNYNGKLNKVFGEYVFTGNETWTLNGTDTSGVYKFHCSFSGLKVLEGGGVKPNLICSGLETKTNNQMYSRQNGIGQNSAGTEIVVFDSGVQTANDMKTFMQGRKLIYELATPTTETLSSKMIPSGITEIIDKNGVNVDYKKQ